MSKTKNSISKGNSKKNKAENQQRKLMIWSGIGLVVIVAMIAGIALTAAPQRVATETPMAATQWLATETPMSAPTQMALTALPAEVSVAEARQMQQEGAFVLDVDSRMSGRQGILRGQRSFRWASCRDVWLRCHRIGRWLWCAVQAIAVRRGEICCCLLAMVR